jgi:ABC-2 type transport system ATP-binding protein
MAHSGAIEASQLRVVRQHNEILKSLNFRLEEGELVGLLGPSGSGKTTLMRALLGVQAITSGLNQLAKVRTDLVATGFWAGA